MGAFISRKFAGFNYDNLFVVLSSYKATGFRQQANELIQVQDMHCFPLGPLPWLQLQAMTVLCKKGRLMQPPPASNDGWLVSLHHGFSFHLTLHRLHQISLCTQSKNIISSLSPVYYLGTTQGCNHKFTSLTFQSFIHNPHLNTHTPCSTLRLDWSLNKI